MEIRAVTDQNEWDGWLKDQSQCSFTQSFEWGEILISEGKPVTRIQLAENNLVYGAAQLVKNHALGFEYFFCPKGPVVKSQNPLSNDQIYYELENYCREKGAAFLRFEPANNTGFNISAKFKKTIDVNPRATVILDLRQKEEELLEQMHSKTRYNIRLAEKKNISVSAEKNFDDFWRLVEETRKRDGFRLHDKKHYEEIIKSSQVTQLTASTEKGAIATAILIGFAGTMTYLFGASSYEYRQLMAPNLLQWEAIKTAKNSGYHYYDLFGIAPHKAGFSGADYEYDEKHQYAGVTRFKLGFGGTILEQPGTYDLIVSEGKYKMYEALRKLRRLI